MFCANCGKQRPQEAEFCPFCGKAYGQSGAQKPIESVTRAPNLILSHGRWVIIAGAAVILVLSMTLPIIRDGIAFNMTYIIRAIPGMGGALASLFAFLATFSILMPLVIALLAKNKILAGVLATVGFICFVMFFMRLEAIERGVAAGGNLVIAFAYLGLAIFAFVLRGMEKKM